MCMIVNALAFPLEPVEYPIPQNSSPGMKPSHTPAQSPVNLRRIFEAWWPLAGSWMLMGLELPLVSLVMARLPDPEIHLAAYGGIVFPLSLLIEAPIIMLLAASTTLSKTWQAYRLLHRFMARSGLGLTGLHIIVAFTPLYDLLVTDLMGMPDAITGPAQYGLQIMTPWTAAIAIRRFQQGVLIRFGKSRSVAHGTAVRLTTNVTILAGGYAIGTIPGIIVATTGMAAGVIIEALFIHWLVRPVVQQLQQAEDRHSPPLTMAALRKFYTPLALTPILNLAALPITSAALSRMPLTLESLAVMPVLAGLSFTLRSTGLAFHEVVVSYLDRPGASRYLQQFARRLACGTSGLLLIITATPLSHVWFATVAGLPPALAALGESALWLVLFMPALTVVESWYQGVLVQSHQTRGVTESVMVYLGVTALILAGGIALNTITGLYVSLSATFLGFLAQTLWLRFRSREARRRHRTPDGA